MFSFDFKQHGEELDGVTIDSFGVAFHGWRSATDLTRAGSGRKATRESWKKHLIKSDLLKRQGLLFTLKSIISDTTIRSVTILGLLWRIPSIAMLEGYLWIPGQFLGWP